jgi:salicylate hydroxylase
MAQSRIALLGDAAHPVLPFFAQGAALAIEDAAVLAHELATHLERDGASGVPAAMAAYAGARAERVARVQATSRSNGRAYHLGRPWSLGRDLVMRRLGPDGMRRRYDWLYDWRAPI